jgi:uncharacterized protein (DUF302 family)
MYGYKKQLNMAFDKAIARVKEELAREGFGVLTEVDVKATLKKKLNVEFDDYIILGACNPPFAYQALQVTRDVGLAMPCNVVIFVEKGQVYVEAAMPTVLMQLFGNELLKATAEQIEAKLKKVVDCV